MQLGAVLMESTKPIPNYDHRYKSSLVTAITQQFGQYKNLPGRKKFH